MNTTKEELTSIMDEVNSMEYRDENKLFLLASDVSHIIVLSHSKDRTEFFSTYFFHKKEYSEKDLLFLNYLFGQIAILDVICEDALKENAYHFVDLFLKEESLIEVTFSVTNAAKSNSILLLHYLYEVKNVDIGNINLQPLTSIFYIYEIQKFLDENWTNWKAGIFPKVNIKPAKSK